MQRLSFQSPRSRFHATRRASRAAARQDRTRRESKVFSLLLRFRELLRVSSRRLAASCADRKHEYPRDKKTAHQIPKTCSKGARARNQVAHDQRTQEPAKVAHGIDKADGRSCRRLAQKLSWHSPESGMERIIRGTHQGAETDRDRKVRSRADGEKKRQPAEQHRNSCMPATLAASIGMPSV